MLLEVFLVILYHLRLFSAAELAPEPAGGGCLSSCCHLAGPQACRVPHLAHLASRQLSKFLFCGILGTMHGMGDIETRCLLFLVFLLAAVRGQGAPLSDWANGTVANFGGMHTILQPKMND